MPSSRVRRLRGEVMVVPLRVAGWPVVDVHCEVLSAAVGIGFIVCLCPEHSLSSGGFAGECSAHHSRPVACSQPGPVLKVISLSPAFLVLLRGMHCSSAAFGRLGKRTHMCLRSSGVEHFPRKEKVVGSNPTGVGSTSAVTRAGFRQAAAWFFSI